MTQYMIDRLCESSTWRGIVGMITAACAGMGLTVSAELSAAIITAGMGVSSLLAILLTDKLGTGK
jgi:hypothetical protein